MNCLPKIAALLLAALALVAPPISGAITAAATPAKAPAASANSASGPELPREAAVPGGIVQVVVASASEPRPQVTREGAPVWTVKRGNDWVAVVGVPLSAEPGEQQLTVLRNGVKSTVAFPIVAKHYPVQHVTLKDNAMIEPPPEVVARIERESAHIVAVRSTWRDSAATSARFVQPAVGRLSGRFGGSRVFNGKPRPPHAGLDIAVMTGTPVVAPADAVVLDIGDYYFCGKALFLDHGNGLISLFCHLSEHIAKPGDAVRQGQTVALSGATGRASGPHLHWSVYLNQVTVEPELFLPVQKERKARKPRSPRA